MDERINNKVTMIIDLSGEVFTICGPGRVEASDDFVVASYKSIGWAVNKIESLENKISQSVFDSLYGIAAGSEKDDVNTLKHLIKAEDDDIDSTE